MSIMARHPNPGVPPPMSWPKLTTKYSAPQMKVWMKLAWVKAVLIIVKQEIKTSQTCTDIARMIQRTSIEHNQKLTQNIGGKYNIQEL